MSIESQSEAIMKSLRNKLITSALILEKSLKEKIAVDTGHYEDSITDFWVEETPLSMSIEVWVDTSVVPYAKKVEYWEWRVFTYWRKTPRRTSKTWDWKRDIIHMWVGLNLFERVKKQESWTILNLLKYGFIN